MKAPWGQRRPRWRSHDPELGSGTRAEQQEYGGKTGGELKTLAVGCHQGPWSSAFGVHHVTFPPAWRQP